MLRKYESATPGTKWWIDVVDVGSAWHMLKALHVAGCRRTRTSDEKASDRPVKKLGQKKHRFCHASQEEV